MHDTHQAPQQSGKPHTYTILTAIESTMGLCTAALTSKKGYTPHQEAPTTSLGCEAWLYKEHLTVGCGNIIDAIGQYNLYRPQRTYKSVTSILTSESRKGGKVPSEPL